MLACRTILVPIYKKLVVLAEMGICHRSLYLKQPLITLLIWTLKSMDQMDQIQVCADEISYSLIWILTHITIWVVNVFVVIYVQRNALVVTVDPK